MEKFTYAPKGTCSRLFEFEIENNIIQSLAVTGGCNGNLKGIARLLKGRNVEEVIATLEGVQCGPRPTSCPDQMAQALKQYLANK